MTNEKNRQDTPEEILEDLMQSEYYLVQRYHSENNRLDPSQRPNPSPEDLAGTDEELRAVNMAQEEVLTEEELVEVEIRLAEMDEEISRDPDLYLNEGVAYQMGLIKRSTYTPTPLSSEIAQQLQDMLVERMQNPQNRPEAPTYPFYITPKKGAAGVIHELKYAGYYGWKFLRQRFPNYEVYEVITSEDTGELVRPNGLISFELQVNNLLQDLTRNYPFVQDSIKNMTQQVLVSVPPDVYLPSFVKTLEMHPNVKNITVTRVPCG
jgi:hypothetical protein